MKDIKKTNYTLEECKEFNQEKLKITTAFIRGNFANGECKELVFPDEANPYDVIHDLIEQFYKREYEIAQSIDIARCEMQKANNVIEHAKEKEDAFFKMDSAISELTKENERLKANNKTVPVNEIERNEALNDLLGEYSPTEWADNMGEVLDAIIMAIEYNTGSQLLTESMRYARSLQKFFTELEKGTR